MKTISLASACFALTLAGTVVAQNQTPPPTPEQSANAARNLPKHQQPSASGARELGSSGSRSNATSGSGGNNSTSTTPNPARDKAQADTSNSTDPSGAAGVRALSGSSGNPNAGGKSR